MTPFDCDQEAPETWGFTRTMDRREFLKLTGTGLLVACVVDGLFGRTEASVLQGGRGTGAPADVNAYLHIGADGRVTCLVGKIEMGQGAMTSLPQLAAEELDVPLSSIDIVMGDTDLCPYDAGTWGSLSTRQFGPVLRAAAAEAKAVLLLLAAERFQAQVSDLTVDNGTIVHKTDRTKRVTYGQLTEGKRIERRLEGRPTLEARSAFTIVGKSAPRRDAIEKVTGRARYAGDLVPPAALHARILRPPAHGATILSADTSAAERLPGVRVVRDRDLIAVLHKNRDEADKALRLVKATFSPAPSTLTDETIFDHVAKHASAGNTPAQGGDLAAGAQLASQVFDETYRKGYVAHAPVETHSAVAAVENGKVTVWAGTQSPFGLKSQLVSVLGLPADKVRVITPHVGGGFGGKSAYQQGVEAARLSLAAGVPVRVVWNREEEFFYDTFDPAAVITIMSGLDAAKKIVLWDYMVAGAGGRGAAHFYDIPHHRTRVRGNAQGLHPFATGPWRAPGANANAFARESHIDVMAAKAGMDPVEFRLHNLADARMRRVLEAAAKAFSWTPKPGPSGRGVGVALGTDAGTYCANMAEVKVDKATGSIRVVRLVAAQDMGLVVNPEGATQQMEGCLMMGLGYALTEDVHFKNGEVLDTNFDTYQIPRFSWLPKIDTVLIDSDLPPQGGGEPAIVQMGAVLANAVFDAVGARVRQLPMTPARVLAAMRQSAG
jgi:isoquinoline 1-oxidoreductase